MLKRSKQGVNSSGSPGRADLRALPGSEQTLVNLQEHSSWISATSCFSRVHKHGIISSFLGCC